MSDKRSNLSPELKKLDDQFTEFDNQVKNLTMDEMNKAPTPEVEAQTKLSSKEIDKMQGIVLKPNRSIGVRDKFNDKFRSSYEFDKEMVNFIAEHKEIIGENIEIWTRPYGGMPAEYWVVPTNKPVWGPRYLADQIKRKKYHRLRMNEDVHPTGSDFAFSGSAVVDSTIQRLDAHPVSTNRSIFMGAK